MSTGKPSTALSSQKARDFDVRAAQWDTDMLRSIVDDMIAGMKAHPRSPLWRKMPDSQWQEPLGWGDRRDRNYNY